ncbi:transcription initiation factor TFIID subunit 4-like [Bacillus rossius redtenbacheri]|uniref:transcription initiation factor TFIID subunit 4-like n=1 Tax=Bacillus rossius redtenbacheri TaxID=93214 RepID=UPI002FDDDB35
MIHGPRLTPAPPPIARLPTGTTPGTTGKSVALLPASRYDSRAQINAGPAADSPAPDGYHAGYHRLTPAPPPIARLPTGTTPGTTGKSVALLPASRYDSRAQINAGPAADSPAPDGYHAGYHRLTPAPPPIARLPTGTTPGTTGKSVALLPASRYDSRAQINAGPAADSPAPDGYHAGYHRLTPAPPPIARLPTGTTPGTTGKSVALLPASRYDSRAQINAGPAADSPAPDGYHAGYHRLTPAPPPIARLPTGTTPGTTGKSVALLPASRYDSRAQINAGPAADSPAPDGYHAGYHRLTPAPPPIARLPTGTTPGTTGKSVALLPASRYDSRAQINAGPAADSPAPDGYHAGYHRLTPAPPPIARLPTGTTPGTTGKSVALLPASRYDSRAQINAGPAADSPAPDGYHAGYHRLTPAPPPIARLPTGTTPGTTGKSVALLPASRYDSRAQINAGPAADSPAPDGYHAGYHRQERGATASLAERVLAEFHAVECDDFPQLTGLKQSPLRPWQLQRDKINNAEVVMETQTVSTTELVGKHPEQTSNMCDKKTEPPAAMHQEASHAASSLETAAVTSLQGPAPGPRRDSAAGLSGRRRDSRSRLAGHVAASEPAWPPEQLRRLPPGAPARHSG